MSIPSLRQPLSRPLAPAGSDRTVGMQRLPAWVERYPTPFYVRGSDIICPLGTATAFGGPEDRGDDGRTASGIRTDVPGGVVGCALPLPAARGCIGTPLPQLPWKTTVLVTLGTVQVPVALIDEGPSGGLASQAVLDMTLEAWQALLGRSLPASDVNTLQRRVSFVIVDGAKHLGDYKPYIPVGMKAD